MKKRIDWVDALKGFGIILVVTGHADTPESLMGWIYGFHMPLFFMLSGLVTKKSDAPMGEWLKKHVKNLLWPYFVFGIVEVLFYIVTQGIDGTLTGNHLLKKITAIAYSNYIYDHNYTGVIWFLTCLFVTEFLFFVIHKYIKNRALQVIVTLALGILGLEYDSLFTFKPPFFADVALTALVFYSMGFAVKDILKLKGSKWEFLLGFVLMVAGSVVGLYNQNALNGKHVSMLYLRYGNPVLFLISTFLLLIGFLFFFCGLQDFMETQLAVALEYIGRNSLVIFSVHLMIMHVMKDIMADDYGVWFSETITTLFFSIVATMIINKYFRKVIYLTAK